jgi:hypothetical protein
MYSKYSIWIFSVALGIPLFISIDAGGNFSFDRFGGYEDGYLVTFPFSVAFIMPYLILNFRNIVGYLYLKNRYLLLVLCISTLFFMLDAQKMVFLSTALFTLAYSFFQIYFRDSGRLVNLPVALCISAVVILSPAILMVTRNLFFLEKYGFIGDSYAIYNYEQYFSFTLNLLQVFLRAQMGIVLYLIFSAITIFVALHSQNDTSLVVAVALLALNILRSRGRWALRGEVIFFLTLFSLIFFPFFMASLTWLFPGDAGDPAVSGFWARVFTMDYVLTRVGLENIAIPFATYKWFQDYGWSMHNQFMSISANYGIIFSITYLAYWISRIFSVRREFRFGLLFFFCISGSMVEILNHPYLALQIAFFLSLSQCAIGGVFNENSDCYGRSARV